MWICKHYNRRRGNDIATYKLFFGAPPKKIEVRKNMVVQGLEYPGLSGMTVSVLLDEPTYPG